MPFQIDNQEDIITGQKSLLLRADLWAMGAAMLSYLLMVFFLGVLRIRSPLPRFLLQALFSPMVLGGYAIARRKDGLPWAEMLPVQRIPLARRLLVAVTCGLGLFIVVNAMTCLMLRLNLAPPPPPLSRLMANATWEVRLLLLLQVMLFAPLLEETFFRLALPRYMANRGMAPLTANLNASLLFAILHASPAVIPGLLAMGMALCFLRQKFDLLCCILAHGAYNLLVAIALLLPKWLQTT